MFLAHNPHSTHLEELLPAADVEALGEEILPEPVPPDEPVDMQEPGIEELLAGGPVEPEVPEPPPAPAARVMQGHQKRVIC